MKFYEMESIKKILGLPSRAGTGQIEARISELLAKEEELEALRGKWEEREKKELTTSQWQALYKSEDWLGVWFGLGIIALAIIYFSMTGLSFKAPKFRWTTGAEFQSHASGLVPLVDRVIQQSEAKGEAAVLESASALKAAIGAQDRKAAGAAAKKLEEAAKQTKDKGLKATAGEVGKDISGQAGNLPDKVITGDNILLAIYIALAYLVIGMIGMAFDGPAGGLFHQRFPRCLSHFLAGPVSGRQLYHSRIRPGVCAFLPVHRSGGEQLFRRAAMDDGGGQDGILHQNRPGHPGGPGALRGDHESRFFGDGASPGGGERRLVRLLVAV